MARYRDEGGTALEEAAGQPGVVTQDAGVSGPGGAGCRLGGTLILAGLVIGLVAEFGVQAVFQKSWSYCFGMPWPAAYDIADSPRFGILELVGYLFLYALAVPVGYLIARRLFRARGRPVRTVVALLAAALLLSGVAGADLMLNISASPADSIPARCPHGRPTWWPHWVPARPAPNP